VTTGNGPARSGKWGFFTLPHGDPPTIGDGFVGTSDSPIFGVGGWIETNTPPAGISLWLDIGLPGQLEVDFKGNNELGTAHAFFGVINTDGFTRFDYLETEFDVDEQKFIFADDFIFAVDANFELGDVNRDGMVNLLDVGPFVDLLTSGGFQPEADINQDGVVSLLDVDPFIALLAGG
jgi:hypothetical protein